MELETALNEATGRLNLAHAELVAMIVKVLETGCWNGHGIRSPEHWVTWKTGVNPVRARDLVLVAKRSVELPVTSEAFNEGLLSVDQVAVISRDTPPEFDETVCTLAKSATVPQLRRTSTMASPSNEPTEQPSTPAHNPPNQLGHYEHHRVLTNIPPVNNSKTNTSSSAQTETQPQTQTNKQLHNQARNWQERPMHVDLEQETGESRFAVSRTCSVDS